MIWGGGANKCFARDYEMQFLWCAYKKRGFGKI